MSWRLVATIFIAIFAILIVSASTAGPIYTVTDELASLDDDGGGEYDTEAQADMGVRAYGNLILIFVFGLIGYGAWYILRRELTEGQL